MNLRSIANLSIVTSLYLVPFVAAHATGTDPLYNARQDIEQIFQPGLDIFRIKLLIDSQAQPNAADASGTSPEQIFETLAASLTTNMPQGSPARLRRLQQALYAPSAANGGVPFTYDLSDPQGQ